MGPGSGTAEGVASDDVMVTSPSPVAALHAAATSATTPTSAPSLDLLISTTLRLGPSTAVDVSTIRRRPNVCDLPDLRHLPVCWEYLASRPAHPAGPDGRPRDSSAQPSRGHLAIRMPFAITATSESS